MKPDAPRCKTCRWWKADTVQVANALRVPAGILSMRFGECDCPKFDYGVARAPDSDGVLIEIGDGWGLICGPEFFCKHWKAKEHT